MKKLPLIEPIKRPFTIQQPPKYCVSESENEKDKFNSLRNYDIAISYYTKGINNDKSNTTFLIITFRYSLLDIPKKIVYYQQCAYK